MCQPEIYWFLLIHKFSNYGSVSVLVPSGCSTGISGSSATFIMEEADGRKEYVPKNVEILEAILSSHDQNTMKATRHWDGTDSVPVL